MKNKLLLILISLSATAGAQSTITVVTSIGVQEWMIKNLDVCTFRNGDSIKHIKTAEEWRRAGEKKIPAWCYLENDPANGKKYGRLYNWYAVNDPRGLAPVGWRIPTKRDWYFLSFFLGDKPVAGKKLKSSVGWYADGSKHGSGTDEIGFKALPGRCRYSNGGFSVNYSGFWWTASAGQDEEYADYASLDYTEVFFIESEDKWNGYSVRCIKE